MYFKSKFFSYTYRYCKNNSPFFNEFCIKVSLSQFITFPVTLMLVLCITTTPGRHCSTPPRPVCYHGLPNRGIWIRLNTNGTIWINMCASVNLHLRPSINSAECCNRNGEQYHEIILENLFSLCRGGVEQWRPGVVVIQSTNINVTGNVLNCDKLTLIHNSLKNELLILQ
jgi:hypothetical protein